MKKRTAITFPCPGPSSGGECCEGALWRDDVQVGDCPRCDGAGELELPSCMEVCGRCRGRGVHDHPAFSNGISMEEFHDDPDFFDDYRAGVYDVPCEECGGANVVAVVDEQSCDPALLEAYLRHLEEEAAYRREVEAERRMGA